MLYRAILVYNFGREADESLVADDFIIKDITHFVEACSSVEARTKAEELAVEERRLCGMVPSVGVKMVVGESRLSPRYLDMEFRNGQRISRVLGVDEGEHIQKYLGPLTGNWTPWSLVKAIKVLEEKVKS